MVTIDLIQFFADYGVAVTAGIALLSSLGSLGFSALAVAYINKRTQDNDQKLRREIALNDERLRRELGTADLKLRQRIETIKVFGDVASQLGLEYREDERARGYYAQQMATMFLIADLARQDEHLRTAGILLLDEQVDFWMHVSPPQWRVHQRVDARDFRGTHEERDEAYRRLWRRNQMLDAAERARIAVGDERAAWKQEAHDERIAEEREEGRKIENWPN